MWCWLRYFRIIWNSSFFCLSGTTFQKPRFLLLYQGIRASMCDQFCFFRFFLFGVLVGGMCSDIL